MTAAVVRMVAFSAEPQCRNGARTQKAKRPKKVWAAPESRATRSPCPVRGAGATTITA